MGVRARGSDATLQFKTETTYGTPPASGYVTLPFVSSALGATQGLIESDLLGQGRAPFDPTKDVVVNDGDVVVPIEPAFFGHWLNLLLGAATVTGSADPYSHVFESGGAVQPSASIPISHPRVPSYSTNYGVRANTLRVSQQRTGLLNATLGMIAKGETTPAGTTTIAAAGTIAPVARFAQAGGSVEVDGVKIGSVVSGNFTFSNNLDKIETIQPDGEIEDADPGMPAASGQVQLRFADHTLLNKAIAGTPIALKHKFVLGDYSIVFEFPRVLLPRVKREITGPGGVMVAYDWQGSGEAGPLMRVTLVSPTASFA